MTSMKNEEEANFTSVTINRDEWMDRAEKLLDRAKNGGTNNKRTKKKVGATRFLINAPTLYLEHESHLFIKAAEAFRVCGKWLEAANAYQQAALTQKFIAYQHNDENQFLLKAATLFCQSARFMNRVEFGLGEENYNQAVSLFCDCDNYFLAGRVRLWTAEMHEEKGGLSEAIDHYQKAAKLFDAEGGPHTQPSTSCLEKAAYLMGSREQRRYVEAADLYATIGRRYLEGNLTKYSAKKFFFRSILLLYAANTDFSLCQKHIDQFKKDDCRFGDSPHCDFLYNLMTIKMSKNLDEFADHVYDFDAIFKLDHWSLDLLEDFFPIEEAINEETV